MSYFTAGQSLSHGTMRNQDLLQSFASALEGAMIEEGTKSYAFCTLIEAAYNYADDDTDCDPDSEEASDTVNALFDALNFYAPEGTFFGAHPGDGSDYGFWPSDWND